MTMYQTIEDLPVVCRINRFERDHESGRWLPRKPR